MTGETRSYESKKPFQKKVNLVEYSADHDSDEEQETVASAEWIQKKQEANDVSIWKEGARVVRV